MRREPVFRILNVVNRSNIIELLVEQGDAGRGTETFILTRDDSWQLRVDGQAAKIA